MAALSNESAFQAFRDTVYARALGRYGSSAWARRKGRFAVHARKRVKPLRLQLAVSRCSRIARLHATRVHLTRKSIQTATICGFRYRVELALIDSLRAIRLRRAGYRSEESAP